MTSSAGSLTRPTRSGVLAQRDDALFGEHRLDIEMRSLHTY
jgi:hypothetical protein